MTTIVRFPLEISRLATLRAAYIKECARFDAAEYEGRKAIFNKRVKDEYYAARWAVAKLNNSIAMPLVKGAEPRIEPSEQVADFPADLPLN